MVSQETVHDSRYQFPVSSFTRGDLVELRSFFLGGGIGDDLKFSEPGSFELVPDRFLLTWRNSRHWSPVGIRGDMGAL